MKEKDFYAPVQQWMKYNWPHTCAIELKIVKDKRFYLRNIEDSQWNSMTAIKDRFYSHKISDQSLGEKPADIVCFNKEPAYFGIIFYVPRSYKNVYMIPIETMWKLYSEEKVSLTEGECSDYAKKIIEL